MRSKTLRGLDLVVYINGKPWAFADSLEWSIDYGGDPIYGVDVLTPFEIPTTRALVSGSLHFFRQHNTAGPEGAGMIPTQDDLPRERYFYLQVTDRQNGTPYLEIPRCKLRTQSGSARAKGIVEGVVTFVGQNWANEF